MNGKKIQDVWSKREYQDYREAQRGQRQYLAELDRMTPVERKLARNARRRELRRAKYTPEEWQRRKVLEKINAERAASGKRLEPLSHAASGDNISSRLRGKPTTLGLEERKVYKGLDISKGSRYNYSPGQRLTITELEKIYKEDVASGWISPTSGFQNYLKLYIEVSERTIGKTTVDGVEVKAISRHFMQRLIGTGVDPDKAKELQIIRRSGVDPKDIEDTIIHGTLKSKKANQNGEVSHKYEGDKCVVTINPDTGVLIQCNPRKTK